MNVFSIPSFDRAFKKLSTIDQSKVLAAAQQLPEAFGRPHVHAALGIRRIGTFYEFRVGLHWRVLFQVKEGNAFLATVGNHDDIRRFIRENA